MEKQLIHYLDNRDFKIVKDKYNLTVKKLDSFNVEYYGVSHCEDYKCGCHKNLRNYLNNFNNGNYRVFYEIYDIDLSVINRLTYLKNLLETLIRIQDNFIYYKNSKIVENKNNISYVSKKLKDKFMKIVIFDDVVDGKIKNMINNIVREDFIKTIIYI